MTTATVTELEVLFTANTQPVEKAAKDVQDRAQKIEKNPVEQKVDGDVKGALDGMDRVEEEAKKIVSAKTMATVDANIERAETSLGKVQERLDYLRSVESTMEVTADIKKAEAAIKQITRRRDALTSARESMVIDADTAPAEAALDDVADKADEAGDEGGAAAGEGLGDGIVDALKAIPVAGGILLAGVAIGKSVLDGINEGLQVEVRQDRLQALTGITEDDARRFASAAGEAYANVFGESIESNMDTARLALQFDLLDEDATARESQSVIQSLAGISDVLGEEVQPIAFAVTRLLQTGLVKSADEAFDILAVGAREGVNAQEDLLDTLTEYPALFQQAGLSAEDALGLMRQGLDAGARDSDKVADAVKEMGLRIREGTDPAIEAMEILGVDIAAVRDGFNEGGPAAREAMQTVFEALGTVKDEGGNVQQVIADLFGGPGEDLGAALFALNLDTAADSLGEVEGAAQRMFDTLADNDATAIEEAGRNIEVAADGIKGALAAAFADPLSEAADWVSRNRGPMLEFFSGLVNGALDFGEAAIEGTAVATEGFGEFVSGPLAEAVDGIANLLEGLDPLRALLGAVGIEVGDTDLQALADDMRGFSETTDEAADSIRDLSPGLDDARNRFNEFMDPQIDAGFLSDATLRLAGAVDQVGYAADGTTRLVDAWTESQDGSIQASSELEGQVLAAVSALDSETAAAANAGEGQAQLSDRYRQGRAALIEQLQAMGLTERQASDLADQYGAVPGRVDTVIDSNAPEQTENVDDLAYSIRTLPDGSTQIVASTRDAQNAVDRFIVNNNGRRMTIYVDSQGGQSFSTGRGNMVGMHAGGVLEFMAAGGLRPMAPVAQTVPPNTWRVVGDRSDVAESYIPHDGSARSMSILLETMRRFGVLPMADGGVVDRGPAPIVNVPRGPVDLSTRSIRELAGEILAGADRVTTRRIAQQNSSTLYAARSV
ncbi:phage tail tape measure protein [Ruania suaedae]|uniref:phage tail tape measure protein n=1 Tax=Ruania suaedae TaxID=2897774 RepID=UPI001E54969E|nr:phage tail tape measure protein [Ruania suaedae]UFU03432.1 phage tail tape measure protein [Ruania suaedae]